ncbi:MAG: phage tail protein [Kingella denitrificans]
MANLQETAQWETGIYQLETSDPVMGGADGIDNRQAKQLGNRTLWLRNELVRISRTIPAAVTKSDEVNSDSSTDVATSKAVKTAYDKAVAAESAASGAVKTSGNQDIGGEKTFTATAFFKAGAMVADSVGDFAANQCLQIGANNVNTYLYNKRSGKYLSMRNDGELRYDGKRLLDASDLLGMVPSGAVLYFAGRTAPAGWLKANGAAVSRTAYAALFAAIGTTYGAGDGRTTFNLPDLRGEFLRGWDDGRGVDTGRALGSAQADAVRQHYHGIGYISPNNDDGAFVVRNWTTAEQQNLQFINGNGNSAIRTLSASSNLSTTNAIDESAGETRPRNVALLAIIKI